MDPTQCQSVFERNRAQVYAWAYRLVQNHHDALDVTQDVFIRWWRAHDETPAPRNPLGWLRRVTVNLAIDAVRSAARKRAERVVDEGMPVAAAADPSRLETVHRVADALRALSDRQRAVVVAKVYDGCTFAQIAEQMEISASSAKSHYVRGLRAMRRRLPAESDEHHSKDMNHGS